MPQIEKNKKIIKKDKQAINKRMALIEATWS